MLKMSKNSIFALNSVLLSQIYLILVTRVSEVTHEIAPVRSFVRPSVRPFVRPFVRPSVGQIFSGMAPQIFLIFCMMLVIYRSHIAVELDFCKKIS